MNGIFSILHNLKHWFESNQIDTGSITIILNITDKDSAARLDFTMQDEFFKTVMQRRPPGTDMDIREMEICGLKVRVESPLHPIKDAQCP